MTWSSWSWSPRGYDHFNTVLARIGCITGPRLAQRREHLDHRLGVGERPQLITTHEPGGNRRLERRRGLPDAHDHDLLRVRPEPSADVEGNEPGISDKLVPDPANSLVEGGGALRRKRDRAQPEDLALLLAFGADAQHQFVVLRPPAAEAGAGAEPSSWQRDLAASCQDGLRVAPRRDEEELDSIAQWPERGLHRYQAGVDRGPLLDVGVDRTDETVEVALRCCSAKDTKDHGATEKIGSPRAATSTSMPRPGPVGTGPTPPVDRGWWPATCSLVRSFMNETANSASVGVPAARCAVVALTMSPPPESSIMSRIPSATAVSRIWRAGSRPPTRLTLRLIWSIASRPAARMSVGRSPMTSSSTIGSEVRRRTARHSSSVGHGCSRRNRGTSRTRFANWIASWRRQAPLASPVISSPSAVSAM